MSSSVMAYISSCPRFCQLHHPHPPPLVPNQNQLCLALQLRSCCRIRSKTLWWRCNRWWSSWWIRSRAKTLSNNTRWWWTPRSRSSSRALRYLSTTRCTIRSNRCSRTWWIVIRARTVIVFLRPNNTSNDSYDDNDEYSSNDNDDSFLGGIKWSLFFFFDKRFGFLSLNRSLNAVSCFWVNNSRCW